MEILQKEKRQIIKTYNHITIHDMRKTLATKAPLQGKKRTKTDKNLAHQKGIRTGKKDKIMVILDHIVYR